MKITEQYEALPKIAKILLQVFLGGLIGGLYRILRYFETKNIVTLVVGILCLVTGVGNFIAWVVDLITEITQNKISVLAPWGCAFSFFDLVIFPPPIGKPCIFASSRRKKGLWRQ